ncbi:hypothetical protein XENTR_v10003024 [Xenopus tropicalis]|nr:hypothetical protein XENTR_v10003024 [Xenopus tropicalis]
MEQFYGWQNLGCMACSAHVMAPTSPDHRGNTFSDLVPVVSTSVLLSTFYPQFTGRNLEAKITNGDIHRGFRNFHGNQGGVHGRSEVPRRKRVFPELQSRTITIGSGSLNNSVGPAPGYFTNLQQLQRKLISGSSRRKWLLPPSSERKSIESSANVNPRMARGCRSKDVFFPPVLDVWAQNDAMQRSLLQRR